MGYNAGVRWPLLTLITTATVAAGAIDAGTAHGEDTTSPLSEGRADEDGEQLAFTRPPALEDAGGSVSCGAANRGALHGAVALPRAGVGYQVPEPWWSRGRRYGTDELVGLITRVAALVHEHHPGGTLGVADLSSPRGGALPGHRSHQSGRDVDLIYYALDPSGAPFPPDHVMAYYTHNGRGHYARSPDFVRGIAERYFDLTRNWALVKALITDPGAEVEHIFVSGRVRRWLLDYARRVGEPEALVAEATRLLRRPRGVDGHNDHMHVRIRCSEQDVAMGRCRNHNARKPRRGRRWRSYVRCPAAPMISMPSLP